jgi:hypothetical protein
MDGRACSSSGRRRLEPEAGKRGLGTPFARREHPWGHDFQCYGNLEITNQESAEPNNVAGQLVEVSLLSGQ